MNTTKLIAVPALMGALLIAATGQQAQAADSAATLTVANFTSVTASSTITMSPSLSDIQSGSIETLGGIDLGVVTNNATGCKVTVSAAAASGNMIAPGDISLRVASAGTGGTTGTGFGVYKALSTTATDLWSTNAAAPDESGIAVDLDVQFGNLDAYPAKGGVTTNYTNTITFTAVANS